MNVQILKYAEGQDPKQLVLDKVRKDVEGIDVYGDRVLVATAPHVERSKGGIFYTDNKTDEGRYQGKVGLILKKGPVAFKYNGQYEWEGPVPDVGDWVFYRTPDSWECGIAGVSCRFISDDLIVGKVNDPELVW